MSVFGSATGFEGEKRGSVDAEGHEGRADDETTRATSAKSVI